MRADLRAVMTADSMAPQTVEKKADLMAVWMVVRKAVRKVETTAD